MWLKKKKEIGLEAIYPETIEGIKRIYASKVRPLEVMYQFEDFYSPILKDSDFDAKPMVLLLGQYSTGKVYSILSENYFCF